MTLAAGTRIGPYEIITPLGAGGMGEVYRARDSRLDRDVALKILPEAFAGDPDRRARFEREAKAVAALSHPNILAIFDVGDHDGMFYAATELLEGQTLRERLDDGPLPPRKAIELGVQIARGLSAAHDRGIVHRDLKPENLFLVGDGQIKILDFGLARQTTPVSGSGATATVAATDPGTVMGTVGYMAPEQVRGRDLDGRADLFSLGVVLYEMVTGERAFVRATAADTMSAILREDPPDISGSRPDLSPALDRIIRHCLEKEPDERFQTARDVAFALTSLSGSTTSTSAAVPAAPDRPRGRGWIIPAAVAIVAALGGLAIGRSAVPAVSLPEWTPRTFETQSIFNARFMPDGQTIVFSSALTGNEPSLFESRADGTTPRPFGPPRTHLLSVSSSGELAVLTEVEYVGQRLFAGTLARMAIDGAPRSLASDVREADWLPDGTDVAVIRQVAGGDQLEFPLGTVVYQAPGYLSDPRVSRDGTRVAFMEHPERFDDRGTVKVVDRFGTVITLTDEHWGEEGVAWSADGESVLYSAGTSIEYRIQSVRADGQARPVQLVSAPGALFVHDVSPDGRFVVTQERGSNGVMARGHGQDAGRDLGVLGLSWDVNLSSDGRFVAFSDGRAGENYGVVMRSVDGAPPARLGEGNVRAISPDGQWVVANLFSTGRCVVYPTGLGAVVTLALGPMTQCISAVWFPDGKHLLLIGHETAGTSRAYRVAFPDGTPEAVLPVGIEPRLISRDGRRVLVRDAAGAWLIWKLGGEGTPVKGLLPADRPVLWADGESSVVVASGRKVPAEILRVDLTSGQRTKIDELAPIDRAGLRYIDVTTYRDGGRQYSYDYQRQVSALFVASGVQ